MCDLEKKSDWSDFFTKEHLDIYRDRAMNTLEKLGIQEYMLGL